MGLLFAALNIIILIAGLIFLDMKLRNRQGGPFSALKSAPREDDTLYAYLGEKIVYSIKFGGLNLGSARFN